MCRSLATSLGVGDLKYRSPKTSTVETISDPNVRDYLQRDNNEYLKKEIDNHNRSHNHNRNNSRNHILIFFRIVLNLKMTYWITKLLL